MWHTVEHHVFIHLIADQQHIGRGKGFLQAQHVLVGPHGGAGVVGTVDDDGPGLGRDGGRDGIKVGPEGAGRQRHAHCGAASQLNIGHIAVVARLQHDDFITWVNNSQNGGNDGLGCAGGDSDFVSSTVGPAIERFNFAGNGIAKQRHAGHGRVLVVVGLHGLRYVVHQGRVAGKVRETLAQVDGLVLRCQRRHDAKNSGAYIGQARCKRRSHGRRF